MHFLTTTAEIFLTHPPTHRPTLPLTDDPVLPRLLRTLGPTVHGFGYLLLLRHKKKIVLSRAPTLDTDILYRLDDRWDHRESGAHLSV